MTILLPVISQSVDKVILDYLSQIQYGDLTSTIDGDWNQNNKKNTDENNNNQVDYDSFGELGNWADEPWTPCDDVDIPEWAKLEGPKLDEIVDVCEDLVWADDPWTQTPLTDIPAWMKLPGIDFDVPEKVPTDNTSDKNDEKLIDAQDNDDKFLASCVELGNWSEEKFEQLPVDVPRWAFLPGIDYPAMYGNSLYWEDNIMRYSRVRRHFGRNVYERRLPSLHEERTAYNNDGKSILYVQTRFGRRF